VAIYHTWYSGLLANLGRSGEAQVQVNLIRDMDPLSVQGARAVAGTYLAAKQYDQATAYIRKVIEQQQDSFRLRMDMGTGYLEKGHNQEAIAEFKKVLELYGPNVFPMANLGIAYARMGRRADAEKILAELKEKGRPGYSSYAIAQISITLGRNQEGLRWLQRAYDEHAAQMVGVNGDQAFNPLHTDPRFQDLVRRVGLPANDSSG
jgi:tetratricopeptide (TPR) repeat protein